MTSSIAPAKPQLAAWKFDMYVGAEADGDATPEQLENIRVHYVKRIHEVLALALPATPIEEKQDEEEREKVLTAQGAS